MKDMATVGPNSKRVYQVWKGNNKFICGGRLIFGPDAASLILSMLLIAVPAILFCWQIIKKIHDNSKPHTSGESIVDDHIQVLGFPALIVATIVMISDLVFLVLTSSRDPGIVPRNSRPPESEEASEVATPSMEWIGGRTPRLRLPRMKDVIVNGFSVKVKYCDTCLLYRPPRASHCSICNNCVQKFDHHCPWVGQCIGLRNYRFFFLFISTSTFLCIYVFTLSWLNIIKEKKHYHNSIWRSMRGEVISLVLIIYTFLTVWFVGGLTIFHTYLISTNQTTYENFRYRYDKKDNPYNRGLFQNFIDVFFTKIPPSMNDFRSWALEETMEAGSFTPNIGLDIMSAKEKVDIDARSKFELDGSASIPSLLQNLDYTTVDCEKLEEECRAEDDAMNPFAEPTIQEQDQTNHNYFGERPAVNRPADEEDGVIVVVGVNEGTSLNGTSPSFAHKVNVFSPEFSR